jgi:hypothetical protein
MASPTAQTRGPGTGIFPYIPIYSPHSLATGSWVVSSEAAPTGPAAGLAERAVGPREALLRTGVDHRGGLERVGPQEPAGVAEGVAEGADELKRPQGQGQLTGVDLREARPDEFFGGAPLQLPLADEEGAARDGLPPPTPVGAGSKNWRVKEATEVEPVTTRPVHLSVAETSWRQ